MEEKKKGGGLDRYINKIEESFERTRRKLVSLIYPSSHKGPQADSDFKRISSIIETNPSPQPPPPSSSELPLALAGASLISNTMAQVTKEVAKQEQEKKSRPKLIKGAFTLVRNENGVSAHDLAVVNGFYKRIIVSGIAILFHSGFTLHFLYQSRFITYEAFPRLYPNMQFIWYPSIIGLFVIFLIRKHSKIIRRMDEKYTPLWLEIKQIYKERDIEREKAKQKKDS